MGYFEYQCKRQKHSHTISTDKKKRKAPVCTYCGKKLKLVEFGFKQEEEVEQQT